MMDWHLLLFFLNGFLMIAWPFLIGHWLFRRVRVDWGLFFVGAATFILSQVGHIPFNGYVLGRWPGLASSVPALAIFAGLSAGVFEESARAITYRFWIRSTRSWRDGLMVGLGHGGVEAIILGLLVLINGFFIFRAEGSAVSSILPPEQEPILRATLAGLRAQSPWWLLAGALERLFAIALHLALSLLVLGAVRWGRPWWLAAAIGWHALANAGAVYLVANAGVVASESFLAIMALISAGIVLALRRREPAASAAARTPAAMAPTAASLPAAPAGEPPGAEELERSRYD